MNKKEQEKIKEQLRELLAEVNTIYTITVHVSRSGMYRVISLLIPTKEGEICSIDYLAGPLLEGFDLKHVGCKAHGVGMDMGFKLVYDLGQLLYNDGYHFKQKWIF